VPVAQSCWNSAGCVTTHRGGAALRKLLINPGRHDAATSVALLLLRAVPALLLVMHHGAEKVTAFGVGVADPFALGNRVSAGLLVAVELVAPILVGVGLFARPAALLAAVGLGLMAFRFPWWDASFLPEYQTAVALELARTQRYLYLTAFAGVLLAGPGAFSLDRLIQGKAE